MRASKFSNARKAFILKKGEDGVTVAELCRKDGISQATYFNRKKNYADLLPDDSRRLKVPSTRAAGCPAKGWSIGVDTT